MTQAVALSGGPDSLCAAALMPAGLALIVDHGLRSHSAREAQVAAQMARDLGHEPLILRWHPGEAPRTQAAYRAARYALLAQVCQDRGVQILWLGHQQDDQVETLLLRLAKGSGLLGLSGMAVQTWLGNTQLYRPLLTVSKAQIFAWLCARNLSGLEDPSNTDLVYPRVQWRAFLRDSPPVGQRLCDLVRAVGAMRNAAVEQIDPQWVHVEAPGALRLSGRIRALARPALGLLLGECIRWVGARAHAPLDRVVDFVRSPPRSGAAFAVGGTLLSWNRKAELFRLVPEARDGATEAALTARWAQGPLWIVPGRHREGGLILGAQPRFDRVFVTKSTPNPLAN